MAGLKDLNGKVAIVTGGASGVGRGIAEQLLAEGAQVIIADIEDAVLQKAAAETGALGVRTDVSDLASVQNLAKIALDRFGRVDIVCNNAGIGPVAKIEDMTMEDWRWMIGVNLWGVIHGVQVFLPLLTQNPDGGHIVNTASMGGLRTAPTMGGYAVTKFGVVALTEALAQELAMDHPKVGATVLCPGPVRSALPKSTRHLKPGQKSGFADADIDGMEDKIGKINWMEPIEAGRIVTRAIRENRLYAITHPEMLPGLKQRHAALEAAFAEAGA